MGTKKFIFKKLIEITLLFFIILTVLFFLFRAAPGDPVSRMIDPTLTPEDIQHLIAQLGLDEPAWKQYFIYIKNFFAGNMGYSFHYGEPVSNIILERMPCTILLFTTSTLLAAFVGVLLGKISAWKQGTGLDNFLSISALVCHTLFIPWFALLILWALAYKVGWFPLGGIISPELWIQDTSIIVKVMDVVHHMFLPLLTLFIIHLGSYLLLMRSSMLSVLREDYIITARAKGLSDKIIRNKHAAKNAALPVITSVGLSLAFSINGGALTEQIFTWPGIGRELIFAVSNNDYPLAQACFLLITAVVLIANLIVDLLYAYLDPRISY
ncbi:MAG: ABC transporter permease [Desulfobacula sp.]|jgi:peptide/nickel transport system permease protein|uniref:ABC transporter permease n=1 Tax=Desulfobacula sp. TaxID=2593537 RepID=UPI001DBF9182|nr:ABC transporter permease [Desulfobacula sp.]MBT3486154.1 ABC transporter permease [Desulfobacula sp.]MBT3805658.1 ABC transporter permease [Desulfobacula sp.]MBT4024878.1 ABC transporter permease [Desulfobacula sp.]MBT4198768.1 ABC transporter permease [Desulfobacula sp.]